MQSNITHIWLLKLYIIQQHIYRQLKRKIIPTCDQPGYIIDPDIQDNFATSSQDSLQGRHNYCDGVSNHHDCLLNRLFRRKPKKTSKRHWPLWGEFTGDTKGQ